MPREICRMPDHRFSLLTTLTPTIPVGSIMGLGVNGGSMDNNELISVNKTKWKRGRGEFVVCTGTHTTDVGGTSWDGKWLVIGCPWFLVRFERNWRLTPNAKVSRT